MSVIALAQNKGGTGKTTTCLNLGVALAELGKRVLLLDFDPQCNLSLALALVSRKILGTFPNYPERPRIRSWRGFKGHFRRSNRGPPQFTGSLSRGEKVPAVGNRNPTCLRNGGVLQDLNSLWERIFREKGPNWPVSIIRESPLKFTRNGS